MTYYLHNNNLVREGASCPGEGLYCNPQPVAVVAYEDREQVERLIECWAAVTGSGVNRMQAAFRKFANPKPPKPDEPLGLGAVVEDAEGVRFSRVAGDDVAPWVKTPVGEWQVECFSWDEINAVRVLSEGVPND